MWWAKLEGRGGLKYRIKVKKSLLEGLKNCRRTVGKSLGKG
jgi:hypothetical protein